jgi:hypothetical protein
MKLMKILDNESVVPVSCLYLNGYSFGDRILEDLVVKLTIVDGKLTAHADWPKGLDADYWAERAVEFAMDMDVFSSTKALDNDDGFILFESGQD